MCIHISLTLRLLLLIKYVFKKKDNICQFSFYYTDNVISVCGIWTDSSKKKSYITFILANNLLFFLWIYCIIFFYEFIWKLVYMEYDVEFCFVLFDYLAVYTGYILSWCQCPEIIGFQNRGSFLYNIKMVFIRKGKPAHFSRVVHSYLNENFFKRWAIPMT